MKPLIGLLKTELHYVTMVFVFELYFVIVIVQLWIEPCNHNIQCVIQNTQWRFLLMENNDLLKTDIDLNLIFDDEKSFRHDNDNEETTVSTHVIKNKTIYQLNNSEFVSAHKKDKNVTNDTEAQSTPKILKLNDIKPKSNKTRNCKNDKRKVSTKDKSNLFESSTKDSLVIISWNIQGLKGHKASLFKHHNDPHADIYFV